MLLIPGIVDGWAPYTFSASGFAISLLLLQSWIPLHPGMWIVPAWSVSAEMGAYAALPMLLLAVRRVRSARVALVLAAAALMMLVALLLIAGTHDLNVTFHGAMLRLGTEFTAGSLLYVAWRRKPRMPVSLMTGILISLVASLFIIPGREATFLGLPAFSLLILIGTQDRGIVCALLSCGPVMFVGRISYSLYLVHWPVLVFGRYCNTALQFTPAWVASNLAVLAAAFLLAVLLHYYAEVPSHRMARRVGALTPGNSVVTVPGS